MPRGGLCPEPGAPRAAPTAPRPAPRAAPGASRGRSRDREGAGGSGCRPAARASHPRVPAAAGRARRRCPAAGARGRPAGRRLGGNRRSPKFPRALTGGAHGAPQARSRASPRPLRHGPSEGRGEGAHCSPAPPPSRRSSRSRSSSPRPPPPHPTPRPRHTERPQTPPAGAPYWPPLPGLRFAPPRPRCPSHAPPPPHPPRPHGARKRALAMLSGSCSSPRLQAAPGGRGGARRPAARRTRFPSVPARRGWHGGQG